MRNIFGQGTDLRKPDFNLLNQRFVLLRACKLQSLVGGGNGLRGTARVSKSIHQIYRRLEIVRLEAQHDLKVLDGVLRPASFDQCIAQVKVGLGRIWLQLQGLLVMLDRVRIPAAYVPAPILN